MNRGVIAILTCLLAFGSAIAGEIHDAARQGALETVKALLQNDPSLIESKLDNGKTPLHEATYAGQTEVAGYLLQQGADVNSLTSSNSVPLHGAAYYGHLEAVKLLVENGGDPNAPNRYNYTPLLSATAGGHMDIIDVLVTAGANLNTRNYLGANAVLLAAGSGNAESFEYFVQKGADLSSVDSGNGGLIHYAADGGNTEIIEAVLDRGADVNLRTERGRTALLEAAEDGHVEAVRLLIQRGADVNAANDENEIPLHNVSFLIYQGLDTAAVNIATQMLAAGADPNARDQWQMTPLHRAARTECFDLVRLLVDHGANTNAVNDNGTTPFLRSVIGGKADFVELMLGAGGDPNIKESHEQTNSLHTAVIKGQKDIVEMILPHMSDINETDRLGNTPLYYAAKYGHKQITETLLAAGGTATDIEENYGRSPLLDRELGHNEAVLWYTGHCGWAIKTQNHLLLFDYFEPLRPDEPSLANGHISASEIADLNVEVFATHQHRDHFCPTIFEWEGQVENLTYYFGFHPEQLPEADRQGYDDQPYEYTAPREQMTSDGMNIQTIAANDAGVGYLIEVDGVKIYHAGDHAGWRDGQRDGFFAEIDYLAPLAEDIDFAFVNVTGCHAGDTLALAEGTFYTLEKLNPKIMVPTHGTDREYVYQTFADKVRAQGFDLEILCPRIRGDHYIFKNDQIL
ncbi:MAG: ankyrin repeat domain-containing protein [Candidatus Zixiibacteriota bacterium]|nr:MAG: ankyrin repeat domain-containing protein [candidate division Zixibacteria bacterium]